VVGIGGIPLHFFYACISFSYKNILVFSDRCTSVLQVQRLHGVVFNIDLLNYCFLLSSELKIVGNSGVPSLYAVLELQLFVSL
jgi:hypothetical protein